ncbi:hypothetical protein [Nocardioides sp.]|uniref:hypothetical protein n=1 Tax=Nocardioides sp. TaxID=35761 RepID=UPI00260E51FF|nr:hypothetical protein [Nocardioides sp.]
MHKRLSVIAALVAPAIAITSGLAPISAAHAVDPATGTVVVTVVDDHDRPVPFTVGLISTAGDRAGNPAQASGPSVVTDVVPGSYGVVALTPWAGLSCAGVAPCTSVIVGGSSPPTGITPVLTVHAGATAAYTLKVPSPKVVAHGSAPGSRLSLVLPSGYQELATVFAAQSSGTQTVASLQPSVTWLRNGVDTGVTATSYTSKASDGSGTIAARLTYNAYANQQWVDATSVGISAFTTDAVRLARGTSRLVLSLPASIKAGRRPTGKVRLITPGTTVSAWLSIKVGRKKVTVPVIDGVGRFKLPKLSKGRYRVSTSWGGNAALLPASASVRLRVR